MTTAGKVLEFLDAWAPTASKESWDNVGLLVGSEHAPVETILVTLDITEKVIDEAARLGAQLIVSHHPVIFQPISNVVEGDVYGSRVIKLIQQGMTAICMHTNLDFTLGGVEDALTEALGLYHCEPLCDNGEGRISRNNTKIPLDDLLFHVKHSLGCKGLRYYDSGKPVLNIATCCGGGGDCIELAAKKGCDTFITGDLKYFNFIEAAHFGINLIDAGHYPTENVIVPVIARRLTAAFPELTIHQSEISTENISYYD